MVNQNPEEHGLMVVLNNLVAYLDDSEIPIVRVHRELNTGDFNLRSARREKPDIPTQYEFRTMPDFQVKLWLNIYLVMVDPTGSSFVFTPKQTAYLYAEANNPLFTSRLRLFAEQVVSTIKLAANSVVPVGDVMIGDEGSMVLDQAFGLGSVQYSTKQIMGRRFVEDRTHRDPASLRRFLTPEEYVIYLRRLREKA